MRSETREALRCERDPARREVIRRYVEAGWDRCYPYTDMAGWMKARWAPGGECEKEVRAEIAEAAQDLGEMIPRQALEVIGGPRVVAERLLEGSPLWRAVGRRRRPGLVRRLWRRLLQAFRRLWRRATKMLR